MKPTAESEAEVLCQVKGPVAVSLSFMMVDICMYIYIYTYVCMYVYMCIYIYMIFSYPLISDAQLNLWSGKVT